MRNRFLSRLAWTVLITLGLVASDASAPVTDAAARAAERALETYKRSVSWEDFGFASHQELLDAQVGAGVPVYRLDFSTAAEDLKSLAGAIRDMKMQEFIVSSEGRPVTRLTLRHVDTSTLICMSAMSLAEPASFSTSGWPRFHRSPGSNSFASDRWNFST